MSEPSSTWSVHETEDVFWWEQIMPAGLSDAAVLTWQSAVLDAGERHGVLRVVSADCGYRFERDGPVGEWLRVNGDRIGAMADFPAGFLLIRSGAFEVASRIAYLGPDGISEGWFSSVGDLATAAGIAAPPQSFGALFRVDVEPEPGVDDGWAASFGTAADIWFARNEWPGWPHREPVDNRLLAALNAPRLNAFLADVRAAGEPYAASWRWTHRLPRGIRATDDDGYITL